jgi:Protein of unknown function (DUF2628)
MLNFLRGAGKMDIYAVYLNPKSKNIYQDALFVAEHFSIFAFIFTWIWALTNRLWYVAIAIFFVQFSIGFSINQFGISPINYILIDTSFRFLIGLCASDLQRINLELKGHKLNDVIVARNLLEAAHRYYGRHVDNLDNQLVPTKLQES